LNQDTPLSRTASRAVPPKPTKPPAKKFRWGRLVFIILAIIIIALGSYVAYLYFGSWKKNLNKISKPEGDKPITLTKEERAQVKPISLVLLGLDTRSETGSMNTDVMMVASFNPITKTATVVSIPRDSDLNMEGYKTHKVNGYYAAFYSNGRKDGLEGDAANQYARDETRQMLAKFFEIPIDYTAVIDFKGFVDVVDALGGVNVTVDKDMRYVDSVDNTNIDLSNGDQKLDGEQALGFVRYRKSNRGTAQSSDFERNQRQSQVLGAITDRLKSFSSVTKINKLLDAMGNNMRTDIPQAQIENLISTYFGINRSDIRFIPLEGEWRSPYVYLNEEKLVEAKKALAEELIPTGRPAPLVPVTASASPSSNNQ
jgi:LCP family protein required for cell wall assembly